MKKQIELNRDEIKLILDLLFDESLYHREESKRTTRLNLIQFHSKKEKIARELYNKIHPQQFK